MEVGGSAPNLPNLHHFRATRDRPMTLEEAKLQMQEAKSLADLIAEREKSEKKIRRVLTPDYMRAQEEELDVIEAKRVKMMDEYNHCINFRDDPLPITKFNYRVNNISKIATMRITRNNQPLNLKIYDKLVLKMLGFIMKLSIAPPPQFNAFELPLAEKKRKRRAELIHKVFVKENIIVDGM
ncbi:hypothetical protein Tco_1037792 [Tanacetum coccineum]